MKGYFSQLARQTGLRFSPADRSSVTAQPVTAPLHVEQVTFVQPTPRTTDVVTAPEQQKPDLEIATTKQVGLPQVPTVQTTPTRTESISEVTREVSDSVDQPIDQPTTKYVEQVIAQPPAIGEQVRTSSTHHEPVGPEQLERTEVAVEIAEPMIERVVRELPSPEPARRSEVATESEPEDPVEREVLVRQYLREVRAWVAASPVPDQIVSESRSSSESEPERVTFAVARDPVPAPPIQSVSEMDVQDLNLSIGNISIVIEEPRPTSAAVVATPPAAPATQPQTTNEPTSLSRYYLRSW